MKRVFVINPEARGGRAGSLWKDLRPKALSDGDAEHFGDPGVLVGQSFDEWVVVGGDGSVQRAVEVLMRAKDDGRIERLPVLRVLPMGTGGDYSRSLSLSDPVPADLGRVQAAGMTRYFANVASVGFSAQVAEAKERNPAWLPRGLAYLRRMALPDGSGPAVQAYYFYGHYYATQAMYLAGGDWWKEWWPRIRRDLVASQDDDGSWADPQWGQPLGTSMALIIMQMPNRYLPIFQK